jgi:hypothetical protein
VFIDNVYYRPATYIKLLKKGSEMGSVFFLMYSDCYFDDLIISIGRTINSFSGSFNTLITSGVYMLNLLDFSDTTNPLTIMYSITTTSSWGDDDIQEYGLYFATMLKNIFNIEVPEVQYMDF